MKTYPLVSFLVEVLEARVGGDELFSGEELLPASGDELLSVTELLVERLILDVLFFCVVFDLPFLVVVVLAGGELTGEALLAGEVSVFAVVDRLPFLVVVVLAGGELTGEALLAGEVSVFAVVDRLPFLDVVVLAGGELTGELSVFVLLDFVFLVVAFVGRFGDIDLCPEIAKKYCQHKIQSLSNSNSCQHYTSR